MLKKAKTKRVRVSRQAINEFKEKSKSKIEFLYTRENMIHEYNWHNAYSEVKKMRVFVEEYALKSFGKEAKQIIQNLKDNDISMTMCVIAKLLLSGAELKGNESDKLNERIKFWIASSKPTHSEFIPKSIVFNNHENNLIADTENILDDFYRSEYKNKPVDYFKYLLEKNPSDKFIKELIQYYKPLLKEIEKEKDLNLSVAQRRSYINFVSKLISDSELYLSNHKKEKKLTRKPRKKKIKSADQLTSKVQFKVSDPSLKITSVSPTTIVGAQYVWLFNTKYGRMTYLVAPDNQALTIKGTTVQNFDENKSLTKKIRKPEKNLSELLNMGKIAMVKSFVNLKTKAISANGRLNKDTVILKASK